MRTEAEFQRVCKDRDEWRERAEEMAERLDERYRAGFDDGWGKAAVAAIDMMPYPLDADGEPIRIGDVLDGYGKTIEVVEMRYGRSGWVLISRDGNGYADCAAFTHHHAPTVEDVLREMLDEHRRWFDGEGERTVGEMVADYASRLRLKEDE